MPKIKLLTTSFFFVIKSFQNNIRTCAKGSKCFDLSINNSESRGQRYFTVCSQWDGIVCTRKLTFSNRQLKYTGCPQSCSVVEELLLVLEVYKISLASGSLKLYYKQMPTLFLSSLHFYWQKQIALISFLKYTQFSGLLFIHPSSIKRNQLIRLSKHQKKISHLYN